MEIGLPIMFNFLAKRSRKKFYEKAKDSEDPNVKLMLRIEKNMERGVYAFKDIDGTYWDYLELMRQLGYILLFGLSFPPCLILAFINNVLEHQVDKAKLVYFKRRPLPLGGSSIGVWRIILYFISIMGIFTQAAILCMTAETFTKDGDDKFVQFLWASLIFVIIRWMIGYLIDDFPLKYRYVLKRHRHIVNKFLVGLPESSRFDDLFNEKTKLSVHSIVNDKLYAADSCNISNEALSKSFDSGVLKVVTSIEATKNNAVKVEDIKLQEKTPGSTLKVPEKGSDEYDASNNVNGSSGSYNSNSDSYFDNSDEEYDDPSGEGEDSSGSSAQESSYMSQSSIPDSSEEEPVDSSEEESKRGN